jgi:hypothetical protein
MIGYELGRGQFVAPAGAAIGTIPTTGRFQVVDPTPDIVRNVTLLDTATGETWLLCNGKDGTVWCVVPRTESMTLPPDNK